MCKSDRYVPENALLSSKTWVCKQDKIFKNVSEIVSPFSMVTWLLCTADSTHYKREKSTAMLIKNMHNNKWFSTKERRK